MGKQFDCIYCNAKVFTSDNDRLYAQAFAVKGKWIAWVGKLEELSEDQLDSCPKVDLCGQRVLAGFVDSHMHAIMLARNCKLVSALPPLVCSIEDMIREIRNVRLSRPDICIRGWGVDEGKLKEKRAPERGDLDMGAADVPVIFSRICGHITYANSKALELAGINRNTLDPEGGSIGRDEWGEPNGILYETAGDLVDCLIPGETLDDIVANLLNLNKLLLSQGVTTCSELGETIPYDYREVYGIAAAKGFAPRVGVYYRWVDVKKKGLTFEPWEQDSCGRLRIAGIKLIGDGSVSGRTAWCDRPYLNTQSCGMPVCSTKDIEEAVQYCRDHNLQISIHAMGAKAIERAVDIACSVEPWFKPYYSNALPNGMEDVPSVRIDHAAMPTRESARKAVSQGAYFVTQPIFMYAEIESYIMNLGRDWLKECYPVADWLDMGVKVAFSSDSPGTSWATPSDPMYCIKAAVTRKAYDGTDCGQAQRIDVETAICLYTAQSAAALGFNQTGKIKEGYAADFIVLDRDILTLPVEDIDKVKVVETYINGKKVYARDEG